jgi:FixJ family two-component response regulator
LRPHGVVLVVDDDADVRVALSRLLASAGLPVRSFGSAEEFLEVADLEGAACLVLDLKMTGATGLELQAELRRRGVELPILFLTGHGDVDSSVRAMKSGAVDFLQKPVGDEELLAAVRTASERGVTARARAAELVDLRQKVATLTLRERQVMALVVEGRLNKQVASALGTAEKTIKVHRARVMEKMDASSLADLVRKAGRLAADADHAADTAATGQGEESIPK